jgi:hypothetical protein
VVIFPIISTLISALCAIVIAQDAKRKPRPDKMAWFVAFALFAIASLCEVIGSISEWTPFLVRTYYLTGAVLVVGYLALGELYLLADKKIARVAPGVTILVTAFAAALVFNSPVDSSKLADEGWEALERSTLLTITTITINAGGTLVIVGGLLYSAWKFKRAGLFRNRMIGCVLIAIGTLIVAMGGTATRLGQREYLYVAMSIGVATIFAGYLWTRRPEGAPLFERTHRPKPAGASPRFTASRSLPVVSTAGDPAIAYLESLLMLDDTDIEARCTEWSVPRSSSPIFSRGDAILAWQMRQRLSASGQTRFDELSVPARRQLADLHHLVLTAPAPVNEPAEILFRN